MLEYPRRTQDFAWPQRGQSLGRRVKFGTILAAIDNQGRYGYRPYPFVTDQQPFMTYRFSTQGYWNLAGIPYPHHFALFGG